MHPIFTNSDLLDRVTQGLSPRHCVNLLRVSQLFFAVAAPLVWRKVEGVHHLLALLPRADIRFSPIYRKRVEYMDLSGTRSQNLARFRLYAPFVKSLEVYGRDSQEYEVKGGEVLVQYAEDGTLLPNLLHLTLTAPFRIKDHHQMFWIQTFLAPSTLDVRVIRTLRRLSPVRIQIARRILTRISEIAPNIQRLSLFTAAEGIDSPGDAGMASLLELPLSDCFKNLPALQEITSTEAILGANVFRAVSGLAELKVLDIWVFGQIGAIWEELDLSSLPLNPFPALEHFSIRGTDFERDRSIFSTLPLFSNLSSLQLGFNVRPTPQEEGAAPWEYQLIELIARECPRLTALNIVFDEDLDHQDSADLLKLAPDGGTALSSMSKLPLKTVHLSNAVLGPLAGPNSVRADALQLAWPLVTELRMPHLRAGFEELYKFSQLPNLQELALGLNLRRNRLNDDFFGRPIGSSSLRTLRGSTITDINTAPDISARALRHCWPNLEEVVFYIGPNDPLDQDDYDEPMSDIREINQELQRLRAFHGNLA
ncbi:hypothetical protein FRC08_015228 [Ceratobasidium sp. 394]|nr:hypothetical protein FRC08_015228 [Ceratobasidium sp. 394]